MMGVHIVWLVGILSAAAISIISMYFNHKEKMERIRMEAGIKAPKKNKSESMVDLRKEESYHN